MGFLVEPLGLPSPFYCFHLVPFIQYRFSIIPIGIQLVMVCFSSSLVSLHSKMVITRSFLSYVGAGLIPCPDYLFMQLLLCLLPDTLPFVMALTIASFTISSLTTFLIILASTHVALCIYPSSCLELYMQN